MSGGETNLQEISQLREDLKTLEKHLGDNRDIINSTIKRLSHNVSKIEEKFESLQTQMNSYQQKTEESIQRMGINVENAFRKALDMQKCNEEFQKGNKYLMNQLSLTKNQLSLTQQQLLGVQSMMTCSRLWVVSHDQFTIGKEIGRGAWATVHEATFRGATVAAKCLHEEIISPAYVESFHREMQIALHCQHHNIVTFLGVTLEDHPVILMELMDINLRSAYRRGNVKYPQVLGILHNIASALHFLHTRPDPVIHRDVSSANVLLKAQYNGEWLAKLGDMGTAKIQQHITTPGPGAPAYAAPEVADPKSHSTKMDVYSFGILVVEILTKTIPFQNLITLKVQVQQQFPQYHQLVTSCTNQQSSDRPTMYDVIGQLDTTNTA